MKQAEARAGRLRLLARLRGAQRLTALRDAAEAEAGFARHHGLSRRTESLCAEYSARRDCSDGDELRRMRGFASEIAALSVRAATDAQRAAAQAEQKGAALAQATRRRDMADDSAKAAMRDVLRQRQENGTDLARSLKGAEKKRRKRDG
ncbi:hypothetical protein [Croceicoccus sp. YJ47]|uniref:hypothetical protein n=1 Tax=Croceicoccus sp. YJ47 TaxID=2798724 RepID=UPI001920A7F1|nr:hypothetical protein [Croceicoccus sp. YJ47]QQN75508.1 hypothetical protein JD971_07810 [Croceicoccus sp. YJ47]